MSALLSFAVAHPYMFAFRVYAVVMKLSFAYMFVVPLADAWHAYGYESFLHVAEYSVFFFVMAFVAVLSELPWLRSARGVVDAFCAIVGSILWGEFFYILIRMDLEGGGIG